MPCAPRATVGAMTTAVIFPGQGSQEPGMRDAVAAAAPELLERAIALAGVDPFERVERSTEFAQPAIFCASVARWRDMAAEVGPPVAVAGHSLGELAALVAADAIDAEDALDLVVLRGRLMARAGGGGMVALLGGDDEQAERLAARHGLSVANFNAPGQVVVSGPREGLRAAIDEAREEGVRAIELGVAGAFHSPAMEPAVAPFAAALDRAPFRAPAVPVVSCHTARPMDDPRRDLADALTRPVRWTDTMRALQALGADAFVEPGPGKVLTRLVKRTIGEPARA